MLSCTAVFLPVYPPRPPVPSKVFSVVVFPRLGSSSPRPLLPCLLPILRRRVSSEEPVAINGQAAAAASPQVPLVVPQELPEHSMLYAVGSRSGGASMLAPLKGKSRVRRRKETANEHEAEVGPQWQENAALLPGLMKKPEEPSPAATEGDCQLVSCSYLLCLRRGTCLSLVVPLSGSQK